MKREKAIRRVYRIEAQIPASARHTIQWKMSPDVAAALAPDGVTVPVRGWQLIGYPAHVDADLPPKTIYALSRRP